MRVQEICDAIERWAAPGLAYSWDHSGLSIGHPSAEVNTVLTTLTVTDAAANEAIAKKADLIVAHHPLIWDPLKNLRTDNPFVSRCVNIAKAGIACYSAHTNFDIASGGINDILADRFGLIDRQPLMSIPQHEYVKLVTFVPEDHLSEVRHAVCEEGAGVIGNYTYCTFSAPGAGTFVPGSDAEPFAGKKGMLNEEMERRLEVRVPKWALPRVVKALLAAHPYEEPAYDIIPVANRDTSFGIGVRGRIEPATTVAELARRVCETLQVEHVRCTGDPDRSVSRIGVLGGGGGSFLKDADPGIEVFITGDIGYHDALAALDRDISVIDAGHDGTENVFVPAMTKYLQSEFPTLTIHPHTEPPVFRYYPK